LQFDDIEKNPGAVTVTFQNSSNMDWASVTGKATTSSNDDPRIKEVWNRGVSAWFGDLGDGVHTGKPEDPRMKLIEIQPTCMCLHRSSDPVLMLHADISYWKGQSSALGFGKEVLGAIATGGVPVTGVMREMKEDEIRQARSRDAAMSS
jgi:general stress protein 26